MNFPIQIKKGDEYICIEDAKPYYTKDKTYIAYKDHTIRDISDSFLSIDDENQYNGLVIKNLKKKLNENIKDIFEMNDIVEAFGVKGVVINRLVVPYNPFASYLKVRFASGEVVSFCLDGRIESWHKTPSLKLIERKKKVIKHVKVWYNPNEGKVTHYDNVSGYTVELTGEYETLE